MTESEQKWIETNRSVCAVLRQLHDALALSSLPPRRTWVGLTYEDMIEIWDKLYKERTDVLPLPTTFGKAIEAKLKEKNNG